MNRDEMIRRCAALNDLDPALFDALLRELEPRRRGRRPPIGLTTLIPGKDRETDLLALYWNWEPDWISPDALRLFDIEPTATPPSRNETASWPEPVNDFETGRGRNLP